MQNWLIVMLDKYSSIARIAEVDANGIFTLKSIFLGRPYTIVLISPDYVLSSVLSITIPTMRANTIRQYFKISKTYLPKLIMDGPIVRFQSLDGIVVENDYAIDSDGDFIPDGVTDISPRLRGPMFRLATAPRVDTDTDGIANDDDPDIDNDGVPNVFDVNDDGDDLPDVIDPDSNGDLTADVLQKNFDLYFKEGLEYIAVQIEKTAQDDGTSRTTMKFNTKLRESLSPKPLAVQIRGPQALLNAAVIEHTAADQTVTTEAFLDRRLLDDGASEDSAPNDYIFGRKVLLEGGKLPRPFQTIFFQLAFGNASDPWFMEFPYLFPDLTLDDINPEYDSNTRMFNLSGVPFGENVDFTWSVTVYNADNVIVHESPSITGSSRDYVLPDNIIEEGESYSYAASAQLVERIQGFPPYIIHSVKKPM